MVNKIVGICKIFRQQVRGGLTSSNFFQNQKKIKSKFVNSLFDEIRRNKRYYKNRVEERQKCLILIPTAQKKNLSRNE